MRTSAPRTRPVVTLTVALPLAAVTVAAAGLLVGARPAAAATTFTWTGAAGDGRWSTAGNWDTGSVPTSAGVLVFPTSGTTSVPMIDDVPAAAADEVDVQADGYRLSVPTDLTLDGSIVLGPGVHLTFAVAAGATASLTGPVSGAGAVDVAGSGTLKLTGTQPNTNTGEDDAHDSAVLLLAKPDGVPATGGDLGAGWDFSGPAVVRWGADRQSAGTRIAVAGTGTLDLAGHSDAVTEVELNAGTVQTGAGVLTVAGDIYDNNTDGTISGNLALTGASHLISGANNDNRLTISATLTGSGPITKGGASLLTLVAACSYTGPLTIHAGTVEAPGGYGGSVSGGGFTGNPETTCPPAPTPTPTPTPTQTSTTPTVTITPTPTPTGTTPSSTTPTVAPTPSPSTTPPSATPTPTEVVSVAPTTPAATGTTVATTASAAGALSAAGAPALLPRTGSGPLAPLLLSGLAALLAGLGLRRVSRRQR